MSNKHMLEERTERPRVARTIHRFSVLIILAWLAITVIVSIGGQQSNTVNMPSK